MFNRPSLLAVAAVLTTLALGVTARASTIEWALPANPDQAPGAGDAAGIDQTWPGQVNLPTDSRVVPLPSIRHIIPGGTIQGPRALSDPAANN